MTALATIVVVANILVAALNFRNAYRLHQYAKERGLS